MSYRRLCASCAAGLVFLAHIGCGHAPPSGLAPPAVVVQVQQPLVKQITDYDPYTGRTSAVKTVEVRGRAKGHLLNVNFEDGAYVHGTEELRSAVVGACGLMVSGLGNGPLLAAATLYPGRGSVDLLFQIDPRPAKAALDQADAQLAAAEAALKLANAELARTRSLVPKGAASREELDVVTGKQAVSAAEVLKAKANLESAALDLAYTRVYAPISGRISKALVKEGNLIGPETLLTTIVSVDPIYVEFPVDERALLRYARRKADGKEDNPENLKAQRVPVELTLADDLRYPYPGILDFADNQVNPNTGTILARAVFPDPQRTLVPGLFARVRIPISDPYKALLITERAIGTDQGLKYVLIVNDQGIVKRRDVKLGTLHNGLRVVEEGLTADDWVIVNGMQRARVDSKVEVTREPR